MRSLLIAVLAGSHCCMVVQILGSAECAGLIKVNSLLLSSAKWALVAYNELVRLLAVGAGYNRVALLRPVQASDLTGTGSNHVSQQPARNKFQFRVWKGAGSVSHHLPLSRSTPRQQTHDPTCPPRHVR